MLKTLYRQWVKTEADKSHCQFLNQSVTSLSNLSRGEGGLNTWWGFGALENGIPSQELADQLYSLAKKANTDV